MPRVLDDGSIKQRGLLLLEAAFNGKQIILGKGTFIVRIIDDSGYGWAIENSLATSDARILVSLWVSSLSICETNLKQDGGFYTKNS